MARRRNVYLLPFCPGDLVGQRLGGEEEHLLLAGEIRSPRGRYCDRNVPVEHRRRLRASPVLRRRAPLRPDWRRRRATTTSSFLPSTPPLALISSSASSHALLVGLEEGGLRLVAVEFADLDGVLRESRRGKADADGSQRSSESKHVTRGSHGKPPCGRRPHHAEPRVQSRCRVADVLRSSVCTQIIRPQCARCQASPMTRNAARQRILFA